MQRNAILALTGAALSEAVAEFVMKWRRLPQAPVVERMGSIWADDKKGWHLIPRQPIRAADAGLLGIVTEVWEPHGDIAAAWMVFMAVPGEEKSLRACGGRFRAAIDDGEPVDGETPAIAMCRAALLATLAG